MRNILLPVVLVIVIGCDAENPDGSREPGTVRLHVAGTSLVGTATVTTKVLGSDTYEVVVLAFTDGSTLEIVSLAAVFTEGRYAFEDLLERPGFIIAYNEAGERPLLYNAERGELHITQARPARIEGTIDLETRNMLSSCIECPDARGPDLVGSFYAVAR